MPQKNQSPVFLTGDWGTLPIDVNLLTKTIVEVIFRNAQRGILNEIDPDSVFKIPFESLWRETCCKESMQEGVQQNANAPLVLFG